LQFTKIYRFRAIHLAKAMPITRAPTVPILHSSVHITSAIVANTCQWQAIVQRYNTPAAAAAAALPYPTTDGEIAKRHVSQSKSIQPRQNDIIHNKPQQL
jgi:hypothetical protein